jgi:hypothetical protein
VPHPRARLGIQAGPRGSLDAFGGSLAGARLVGLIDLLEIDDPGRKTEASARACHYVYEWLPDRHHGRGLTAQEFAGAVDRGLGIL